MKNKPILFKFFIVVQIISGILLLIATGKNPYDYYIFLRYSIFVAAIIDILIVIYIKKYIWILIFGIIVILFNPIIPINLSRGIWKPIDIISAIIMFASIYYIKDE